jgi:glutamate decarboxylase
MLNNLSKARLVSRALENSGYYSILSNVHRAKPTPPLSEMAGQVIKGHNPLDEEDAAFYNEGLPVVSFRFTDEIKAQYPEVKQAWVQEQLRAIGWIVPK